MDQKPRGVIGILTGGGDVPGLNPAIRAVTIRAAREGVRVVGIRRDWAGLIAIVRAAASSSPSLRCGDRSARVVEAPGLLLWRVSRPAPR